MNSFFVHKGCGLMIHEFIRKNRSFLITLLPPLILFTVFLLFDGMKSWKISLLPYSGYVVLITILYWINKNEKRKNIFFLILGLLIFCVFLLIASNNFNYIKNNCFATGKIVNVGPVLDVRHGYYKVDITFTDRKGENIVFNDSIRIKNNNDQNVDLIKSGDLVEVVYDSKDSKHAKVYDSFGIWFLFVITLFISISTILGSIIRLKKGARKRRKAIIHRNLR
ncbi:MAG TPA: DUF3592 domain-containing protein [Clostridia bacterium]